MSTIDEPHEIVVQLGGRKSPKQTIDPSLRQLVETVVRRAYPRARVTVFLNGGLEEDLVHVIEDPEHSHAASIHKLIEYARTRLRRSGP